LAWPPGWRKRFKTKNVNLTCSSIATSTGDKNMKKTMGMLVLSGVVALVSTPAMAQFAKAEDAIKYRASAMALMGSHFGRMAPVAKKEIPYDKDSIKKNVEVLSVLATLPWVGYGAGTEGGEATDEVWLDPEGFKKAQDEFQGNFKKLTVAADAGDFDAFRVAFGATGKSCKACHDVYRKEKK
jgi:cytochrome c556